MFERLKKLQVDLIVTSQIDTFSVRQVRENVEETASVEPAGRNPRHLGQMFKIQHVQITAEQPMKVDQRGENSLEVESRRTIGQSEVSDHL
jgi:hypothetical protein